MSEFLELVSPAAALEKWVSALSISPVGEWIPTETAVGRVILEPVFADHPLPEFPRATVDGYAVRARDTHGAGESLPAYLTLAGEVSMGVSAAFPLQSGECALIHTGGMLPAGADAVVMVEHSQEAGPGEIEILKAAAAGENVIFAGEDVRAGQEVIAAGTRLRPAEIGGLMALGITQVGVARRPKVTIISSGDEVVPPGSRPGPGQVRDVNTYTLKSLVEMAGGEPLPLGIIPDRPDAFLQAAYSALSAGDMVLFTAGSSVSVRDLTARTIDALGPPGVLVHGVSIRPGKPTILAVCAGKPVIGLPGNPASALIIAAVFVIPMLEKLLGARQRGPSPAVPARLSTNLASQAGREDWVPVRLVPEAGGYAAEPIFGRSNLIFTLAGADGLVRIPSEANGIAAGTAVQVIRMSP